MPWVPEDITAIDLETDACEGDLATIRITTPAGVIEIMGHVDFQGRTLLVRNAHIQGLRANAVGRANLHVIAKALLERIDCDEIRIEGEARTTGANPGHRPREIRFTR
jgi:hypothetical protein